MIPSSTDEYEDRSNNRRHQKRSTFASGAMNILCQPSSFGEPDWRQDAQAPRTHCRAPPVNGYGHRAISNSRVRDPLTNNPGEVAKQLEELREDNKLRSNRSQVTFGAEGSDPFLYKKKTRGGGGGGTSRRTNREPMSCADVKAKNMTSRVHFGGKEVRDPMPGMTAQVRRYEVSRTAPADLSHVGMAEIRKRKEDLKAQADKLQLDMLKKTKGDRARIKERNGDSHFSFAVAPKDLFHKQNNQLSSPIEAKIDYNARAEGKENTRANQRSQIYNLEFGKGGAPSQRYQSKRPIVEGDLSDAEWDRLIHLQQKKAYKLDLELQELGSKSTKFGPGNNGL